MFDPKLGVAKAFKNVTRLKEILAVLAKNGLSEVILKSGILSKVPHLVLPKSGKQKIDLEDSENFHLIHHFAFALRQSFEELGPSFIKLGQLLSSREEELPQEFVEEMKKLQSHAKPVPFELIEKELARAFDKPYGEIFKHIDKNAIGTASVGVVHRAELLDGTPVVLKIRRPSISEIIETDFHIMLFIIESFEKLSSKIKFIGLSRMLTEFQKALEFELDFRIEANNNLKIQEAVSKHDNQNIFKFPKIYPQFSNDAILVMDFLDGIPFNNKNTIKPHLEHIQPKLMEGIKIFLRNILNDGIFHADLHGGNFFYLPSSEQIGIVDFGLVGTMGKKNRSHFVAIIYALVQMNFENLAVDLLEIAEYEKLPDADILARDIKEALAPFLGMNVADVSLPLLHKYLIRVLTQHEVYLPRDWYLLFRALGTLDGVARSLEIDFDLLAIIKNDLDHIMAGFTSPEYLMEEGVFAARDIISLVRFLPRHLKWMLKDFSRGNYALKIEFNDFRKQLVRLNQSFKFIGASILFGVLFFSGIIFLDNRPPTSIQDIPTFTLILWAMASVVIILTWPIRK